MLGYAPIPMPTHADAALWGVILVVCLVAISFLPALINSIWPVKRKFIENVCGQCGYSLQGLPGDICPECGADTRIVGKRRPRRRIARNVWIACATWVALVFWLDMNYGFDLRRYLLRARYGIEAYGASSQMYYTRHSAYPASSITSIIEWYRAIEIAMLAIGLAGILLVAKWMRGRSKTAKPPQTTP